MVERRAPLGMNTGIPADRACSSRSTVTIPEPENPYDDHLDLIVYVFSDALSGAEPHHPKMPFTSSKPSTRECYRLPRG
jgi:hypothetical protein